MNRIKPVFWATRLELRPRRQFDEQAFEPFASSRVGKE